MRGEIIKAFIALREGFEPSDKLKEEIRLFVKQGLAAHAAPREIEFKDKLALRPECNRPCGQGKAPLLKRVWG